MNVVATGQFIAPDILSKFDRRALGTGVDAAMRNSDAPKLRMVSLAELRGAVE